ncbi:hypothetical protein [Acinetobacter sp. ANC 4648]|uniref:hypothetical protein n=1 Tax=Acinetobacter sp. ANC 4648 TaxID=1977875 RepID=UPI000A357CA3|nr:hypothetical protein [Acinetobacter sp. ANC 4648]OTG84871.1 hypothetical protein B9T27_01220 [Acinetobacter sp. ANC 4648]
MNNPQPIDPRHYSVRPEWIWTKDNENLTKTASLVVNLKHHKIGYLQQQFEQWLQKLSATKLKTAEYAYGGCGFKILAQSDTEIQLILFSAGQDALESLDELVQNLYSEIILHDPAIEVLWKELPLQS